MLQIHTKCGGKKNNKEDLQGAVNLLTVFLEEGHQVQNNFE